MANNTSGQILNYKEAANVRVDFFKTQSVEKQEVSEDTSAFTSEDLYFSLRGFLSDNGLTLDYTNNFAPSLDLAGSIAGQFNDLVTSLKGTWDAYAKGAGGIQGYVGLGKNSSLILNAPYMWQGTNPIRFKLSMFQIAEEETSILESYQRVLEAVSPNAGPGVNLGAGPMLIFVEYFPPTLAAKGKISFGPCLCFNVNMQIKAPYSLNYEPLIGEYNFDLMVSRLIDRSKIYEIFNGGAEGGSKYPYPPTSKG
jgi:hypothetical protein